MAVTRANVETILVKRAGGWMGIAGLAVTTVGTNADLSDPIETALRQMGKSVATPTSPSTSDLAAVADDEIAELLDRAELRVLENAAQNYTLVDTTVGPRSERLGQLQNGLMDTIKSKREWVAFNYGNAGDALTTGIVTLDFQQESDDE